MTKTHEQFINEIQNKNDKIIIIGKYTGATNYIKARCKRCNNHWEAKAYSLLQGHGCPRCSKSGTSFMEQFIRLSFIKKLSEKDVISRDRKTIGMELDILIPKFNIAIEPGNWFLHKKLILRDSKKRTKCAEKGIKLITIYDKFPENEDKPFLDNCIVFSDDYNKADHSEIKNW